jgi:hypothetical protein
MVLPGICGATTFASMVTAVINGALTVNGTDCCIRPSVLLLPAVRTATLTR